MGRTEMYSIDADRLRSLIKARGMTQPQVASAIGVAYQGLNRGINEGRLSAVKFKAICALLDSDVDYVLGKTDKDFGYMKHNEPAAFNTPLEFEMEWYSQGGGVHPGDVGHMAAILVNFQKMNDAGQQKLVELAELLAKVPEFQQ